MKKVEAIWFLQGGKCFYCNGDITAEQHTGRNPQGWNRDHLWPRALGGSNDKNVVLAHKKCNSAKANREPTRAEFDRYLRLFGHNAKNDPRTETGKARRMRNSRLSRYRYLKKRALKRRTSALES